METEEEFTAALAALRRRSSDELARFIVSLLYSTPPGIRAYLEAFIAAADPHEVATIVRREMRTLCAGEREYDVRHRRGAEFVAQGRSARATRHSADRWIYGTLRRSLCARQDAPWRANTGDSTSRG